MPTSPSFLAALGLAFATAATAADTAGGRLYRRYCASCHGTAGRGDGPVAPVLKTAPTDLTTLEVDVRALMQSIDGRRAIAAHGPGAMPVWGEVFEESLLSEPHARRTALLRVQEIAEHVVRLRPRR